MQTSYDFSDIAPYTDAEVPSVLEGLKKNPSFHKLLKFMNLETSQAALDRLFAGIETIDDFQDKISRPWIRGFLDRTAAEITYNGIDDLDTDRQYLYISNHRDIVLDSALLNVLFSEHGIQTVETAIGDNLLKSPVVKTLTKLNKNFTVNRSAEARALYRHSVVLSTYIRGKITSGESSIWIAQREGRAKDGNDRTQQGVVKMLNLSNQHTLEEGCKALHIRPLSLSYEYDPCDRYKVRELLAVEAGEAYVKEEEEDFKNIIAGFLGQKGRIHLSIQPQLKDEINALAAFQNTNDKISKLAEMIDHAIYRGYRLFENNYAACDMLYGTGEWAGFYTPEKKQEFEEYVNHICRDLPAHARKILYRKYAYPLINKLSAGEKAPLSTENNRKT